MQKILVLTLTCLIGNAFSLHTLQPELVKKQAVYTNYSPPSAERFFGPQPQLNPLTQPNQVASVGSTGQSVSYKSVPQQQGQYIPSPQNSIPGQFNPKQVPYYPSFYPVQQPFPPSFLYIPPQNGRFPAATDGTDQQGGGSWFNWGSQQWPSFPANWPSGGNFPSNPFGGFNFPNQLPNQFPGAGYFPFGSSPAGGTPVSGAAPAGSSESAPGTTTNTEGNSVVVVGNREKPEKLQIAEPTTQASVKSDNELKSVFEQQQPQYFILGQPQLFGEQTIAFQGEKDPSQLNSAGKGAISSFLIQPQPYVQPSVPQIVAQPQFPFQPAVIQQQPVSQKSQFGPIVPQQTLVAQPTYSQQVPPQPLFNQFQTPQFYSQLFSQQNSQSQQGSSLQPAQQVVPQKQPVEYSNLPGASVAYQRFLQQNKLSESEAVKLGPKAEISTPSNDPAFNTSNNSSGAESVKLTGPPQ